MLIDLLIQMFIIWMLIQNVDTNVHHIVDTECCSSLIQMMLIQNVDRFVDTNVHHIMLIQNVD